MINTDLRQYEVVLDDKHFLGDLVESITLEDSLEEIAYRARVKLVATPELLTTGIKPGQKIRVSGIPFGGTSMVYLLHPGMVWECESYTRGLKHLDLVIYDHTIYLAKSEDEYLLPAGQTAGQRLAQYAVDWDIELGNVVDTSINLSKAVYRAQPIYSMIQRDLKETAEKDGGLFRPRMTPNGLELIELGSNSDVWILETDQNIQELIQKRTLEGTVTQVKVLGNAGENQRSPVLALEKGEIDKFGTLQKVIQNGQNTTAAADAQKTAQKALSGLQESFCVTALDINTIRAGDKVWLLVYMNDKSGQQPDPLELYVISVIHELGRPGRMTLELSWADYIRRRYYLAV